MAAVNRGALMHGYRAPIIFFSRRMMHGYRASALWSALVIASSRLMHGNRASGLGRLRLDEGAGARVDDATVLADLHILGSVFRLCGAASMATATTYIGSRPQ